MDRPQPAYLAALSLASLAGFFAITHTGRRRVAARDVDADLAADPGPGTSGTADDTPKSGREWLHVPVAAGVSLYLGTRTAVPAAAIPTLASLTAEAVTRLLDSSLPPAPVGRAGDQGVLSGPTAETTAVAFTTAYALAREHLLTPQRGLSLAAGLSTMTAAGRLYHDEHWGREAAAGALLGVSMAAAYAAIQELRRDE